VYAAAYAPTAAAAAAVEFSLSAPARNHPSRVDCYPLLLLSYALSVSFQVDGTSVLTSGTESLGLPKHFRKCFDYERDSGKLLLDRSQCLGPCSKGSNDCGKLRESGRKVDNCYFGKSRSVCVEVTEVEGP
jgi:hypothetical protein